MSIVKPLTTSLVAETHKSYYSMHKYWSRKPHNIVRSYIEHFTEQGDIVADPFLGSGVTVIEALITNRNAIGIDINPMSKLITEATLISFEEDEIRSTYDKLKEECKSIIKDLFTTEENDKKYFITHVVWESTANCPKCDRIIELFSSEKKGNRAFLCNNCEEYHQITSSMVSGEVMKEIWYLNQYKSKVVKTPTKRDFNKIVEIENFNYKIKLKSDFMFKNKRTLVHEGMNLKNLFTKRNLIALSLINESINKIKDKNLKKLFRFVFSSSVAQSSRLIPYRGGFKSGGPAWTVSGFWIPRKHFEINPWNSFRNKYKKILKGKKKFTEENSFLSFDLTDSFSAGTNSNKHFAYLETGTSTNMKNYIPDESVDYIFTDPPYGDSIPYLEYSTIWNNWFYDKVDSQNEIIISDSKIRNKDVRSYSKNLKDSIRECFRVLKKGKWISITFNNRDFEVWRALINAINKAGFEIINSVYQIPAVIPAKSQLSKSGSTIGDLIINARKPTQKKPAGEKISKKQFSNIVLKIADKCIGERGGIASTDQINRSIMLELIGKGIVDFHNDDLVNILKETFESKKGFWKHKGSYRKENYAQINDKIKSIVSKSISNGIFDRKQIIQEVFNKLKGSKTPDISEINIIINSALSSRDTMQLFT